MILSFSSLEETLATPFTIPRLGRTIRRILGAAGDILPSSVKPASSAGKKTLLFFLFEIAVDLVLIDLGDPKESGKEHNHVYAKEGKLSPEKNDTEEGEIDGDTVDESAQDGRRANILRRRIFRKLAAGLNEVLVLGAVGLLMAGVCAEVAVCLRTKGGILRCDDHGDRVVDAKDNEREQDGGHQ